MSDAKFHSEAIEPIPKNGMHEPKNIVICCDGTSNRLETAETNVWKLFKVLDNDQDSHLQVSYYDPGVGTMATAGKKSSASKKVSMALGLAFGIGFTKNLEEAYRFLMQQFNPNDRIFMFGFSRGAYTVRALAGMIHMFGLLERDQENLIPYISRAYRGAKFDVANKLIGTPATRSIDIRFLGLWDTVSSLGFAYNRKTMPFTANNRSVLAVRHAVAVDERRAYFRQNRWGRELKFTKQQKNLSAQETAHEKNHTYYYKHDSIEKFEQQDFKEVWFAGVHSDVGGGYEVGDDMQSKIPFHWMVEEARNLPNVGLRVKEKKYLYEFEQTDDGKLILDAGAKRNESLVGPWWILEFLPMNYTLRRREFFFPFGRRRQIRDDVTVHESVVNRLSQTDYKPPNLSGYKNVELWHSDVVPKISMPDKFSFAKNTTEVIKGLGYLAVAAYTAVLVVLASIPLAKSLIQVIATGQGWPPDWNSMAMSLLWPIGFSNWAIGPGKILAVPVLVFLLGAWVLKKYSGFADFEPRVHGRMIHMRWQGYGLQLAKDQMGYLRDDGRNAYFKMLKMDLAFPFFYGSSLIWALFHSQLAELFPSWQFLIFLPVIAMVADWIENTILLKTLPQFHDDSKADGTKAGSSDEFAIRVASLATTTKIITLVFSCAFLIALSLRNFFS